MNTPRSPDESSTPDSELASDSLKDEYANTKRSLYWLIGVSIFAAVIMTGGRTASTLFALHDESTKKLAGFAYSFYSLVPAFFSLSIGRLVGRIGPRKVIRYSLILLFAALLLPVFWQSMTAILITACLSGLGFSSYMISANVAVGMMPFKHANERVGMFGWLQTGNSFAAVLGPSTAGFMIDHYGFRAPFLVLACSILIGLFCAFKAQVPDRPAAPKEAKKSEEHVIKTVLKDGYLLRIFLVSMTISLAWDCFVFMVPVLGVERRYSATEVGMLVSAFACGTFAIRVLLPLLSRRFSDWQMLCGAFGASCVVFMVMPFIHSYVLHAALGFVFGLAAGQVQPNVLNLVYRSMPKGRESDGVGLRSMMGNLMGFAGPSLFNVVTQIFSVAPVFLIVSAVMGVSSWQAFMGQRWAERRLRREIEQNQTQGPPTS